jgi:allophanate hydrolase subunit 2
VLGSRSMYAAGGIGMHGGRGLRAADVLPIGHEPAAALRALSATARITVQSAIHRQVLMATPSPHAGAFSHSLEELRPLVLCTVADSSDRTGIRLTGLTTTPRNRGSMISEGTTHGAIQVPDENLAIILGPDRPTTGGYPVFATIAATDLPALGQLRPGDRIRLQPSTLELARQLYRERWNVLDAELPPSLGSM